MFYIFINKWKITWKTGWYPKPKQFPNRTRIKDIQLDDFGNSFHTAIQTLISEFAMHCCQGNTTVTKCHNLELSFNYCTLARQSQTFNKQTKQLHFKLNEQIHYLGVGSQDMPQGVGSQDKLQGLGLRKKVVLGLHNNQLEAGMYYRTCSHFRSSSQVAQVLAVAVESLACGLEKAIG